MSTEEEIKAAAITMVGLIHHDMSGLMDRDASTDAITLPLTLEAKMEPGRLNGFPNGVKVTITVEEDGPPSKAKELAAQMKAGAANFVSHPNGHHPAVLCEHANEVPTGICPCKGGCYCKGRTCQST